MRKISVPQLAWYETGELELSVPDSWQVEIGNMAGFNRPALKPDQIKAAISSLTDLPPIRELARGRNEVVIIFDDMTRVTRVAEIVPFVLEELAEAGIPDSKIRFVVALGAHGALDRLDFVKKLGAETVARFPVYNHNAFGNCTYIGKTKTYGTEVYVNEEVMKCDLKIAIGSVVPHPMSGFGGGGKIILPGVASFETIKQNHEEFYRTMLEHRDSPVAGMALFDDNPMRLDIEEAATMAGLDVLINCIFNTWGETVAIFAGALKPAYAAAVQEARNHYRTPRLEGKDIAIANGFSKSSEAFIGLAIAYRSVKRDGSADVVLIANAPEGQVTHYLLGTFGTTGGGPLRQPPRVPQHINRLIIYTEYPELAGKGWVPEADNVLFLHKWDDVLQALGESHGADTRVAVYPNADVQYCV
jgi:nickel-dependent lactate racemase